MRGIGKRFPGVHALKAVGLELHAGECLALLGENGAGKSTLLKMLGGAHQPDEGEILIEGQVVDVKKPADALSAGLAVIYQEFNLVPGLTARENVFLGQEPGALSFVPARAERKRTRELFKQLGASIDPESLCRDLTVADQQVVEIAKALSMDAKVIVMDEPSAALSPREVEGLFEVIRGLKERGIGIIYVSHRLDEIFEIADRVTVLRDGEHVGTRNIEELTRDSMIELMVGRSIENEYPKEAAELGEVRLACQNLSRGKKVKDVSFEIRRGEILGLTGLVGAGRTETARLVFGADRPDSGALQLDGQPVVVKNPRDAIEKGICLLTEDRKGQGLIIGQTVRENFGLPNLRSFGRWGFIDKTRETEALQVRAKQLQVKFTGSEQIIATL